MTGSTVDKVAIVIVCVQNPRQSKLPEIAQTHCPFSLLSYPVKGRHQYRQENRDNSDDDQEFYEREASNFVRVHPPKFIVLKSCD
jgi:hypothetical protein